MKDDDSCTGPVYGPEVAPGADDVSGAAPAPIALPVPSPLAPDTLASSAFCMTFPNGSGFVVLKVDVAIFLLLCTALLPGFAAAYQTIITEIVFLALGLVRHAFAIIAN